MTLAELQTYPNLTASYPEAVIAGSIDFTVLEKRQGRNCVNWLATAGRKALHLEPTELDQIVQEVIAELREEAGHRQIEWRVGDLPSVECDPALIRQLFVNLLGNSVKYTGTRDRAVIEIGWATVSGEPAIFVRDNGTGFDMRCADKIFNAFQRLHHDNEFKGSGIGLATVHRIIQRHGGRIWADSALCPRRPND